MAAAAEKQISKLRRSSCTKHTLSAKKKIKRTQTRETAGVIRASPSYAILTDTPCTVRSDCHVMLHLTLKTGQRCL